VCRLGIFIPLAYVLSMREGYVVDHIWYASVLSVFCQGIISFLLVRRELRIKLKHAPLAPMPAAATAPAASMEGA
jgi:Na+-driven multidrug efflux pump